jgi:hypothetical protein
MKKIFFILIITVYTCSLHAQQIQTYTEMFDSLLIHISRTDASTGVLYDRVVPFANITDFTVYPTLDTSQKQYFIQSYSELYRAAFFLKLILPQKIY